jgi:hypothetical protein
MLGFRIGDTFRWPVPGGTARVRIRRLLEHCKPELMEESRR